MELSDQIGSFPRDRKHLYVLRDANTYVPNCLQGKTVSRRVSSWCGSILWGKWGSRRPWPLFPQNVRNVYICIYLYFLHFPLLFFRTEIIVMTISVFYKKRTRKLPNTNWGRLRILFLLLYKGFWQFDSFFFSFLFWERGEENRGEGIRCRVH